MNSNNYFKDRVFLVTGASGGIGRAIAQELVLNGSNVVLVARRKHALLETQTLSADLAKTFPVFGDITDERTCRKVIGFITKRFGRLDGLIQNAGVSQRSLAENTQLEVYKTLMDVNFYSMVNLFRLSLPLIKESKGHIVGISSVQGLFSTQFRSGYAAAKHALQGFMDSARLEVSPYGIHVMTVSPGFVKTDVAKNALTWDGVPAGLEGKQTASGLSPDYVAKRILEGIQSRKRDLIIAQFKERFAVGLQKISPSALDKILLRMEVV